MTVGHCSYSVTRVELEDFEGVEEPVFVHA